jgi:hypothetical protein
MLIGFTAVQQLFLDPNAVTQYLLPFEGFPYMRRLKAVRVRWLDRLGGLLAWAVDCLGPGYTCVVKDKDHPDGYKVLAPGHAQALLWLGIVVLIYLGNYVLTIWFDWVPVENWPFPSLFNLLLLVFLVGCLLAGLSFLLDYYRIPVLLTLGFVSMLLYQVNRTDHYYDLNPGGKKDSPKADLQLTKVFHDLPKGDKPRDRFPRVAPQAGGPEKRTLVVVTAAGGGIQAAAWTAEVLAGLDKLYQGSFTRSIGLISAVSGGSVGTMYYIANGDWAGAGDPFDDDARGRFRHMASASSLEATSWGLSHPDLIRTFVPLLINPRVDRGWAIEQAWGKQLATLGKDRADLRLRDWVTPIREGKMPVVVFNATLVETGQRLLISPVRGHPEATNATDLREFFDLYGDDKANPRVTTVVRLSATFPYISPISRPYREPPDQPTRYDYHVADGGYADNEGAFTAMDWIDRLIQYYNLPAHRQERPFDRVLLLRIQPFPIETCDLADKDGAQKPLDAEKKDEKCGHAETDRGWVYAAIGPIKAIENVRTASQAERNSMGLRLLTRAAQAESPEGRGREALRNQTAAAARAQDYATQASIGKQQARSAPPDQAQAAEARSKAAEKQAKENAKDAATVAQVSVGEIEITWTAFIFQPSDSHYLTPLSWKLTRSQVAEIGKAWERIVRDQRDHDVPEIPNGLDEAPLKTVDRFFRRRPVP